MTQTEILTKFNKGELVRLEIDYGMASNFIVEVIDGKYEQALSGISYKLIVQKTFQSDIYREGDTIFASEDKLHFLSSIEEALFLESRADFNDLMVISDDLMLRKSSIIAIEIIREDDLEEMEAQDGLYVMTNHPLEEGLFLVKDEDCARFLSQMPRTLLNQKFLAILNKYT